MLHTKIPETLSYKKERGALKMTELDMKDLFALVGRTQFYCATGVNRAYGGEKQKFMGNFC